MMGAVCGDVIGSVWEFTKRKGKDFEFFSPAAHPTDDTYHTVALAELILSGVPIGQEQMSTPGGRTNEGPFHIRKNLKHPCLVKRACEG